MAGLSSTEAAPAIEKKTQGFEDVVSVRLFSQTLTVIRMHSNDEVWQLSIQGIKSFFGHLKSALAEAKDILFAVGDSDEIEIACEDLKLGWQDEQALFFTVLFSPSCRLSCAVTSTALVDYMAIRKKPTFSNCTNARESSRCYTMKSSNLSCFRDYSCGSR
jgi:hypothetical protein